MPLIYISIPFSYMSTNITNSLDISSIIPIPESLNNWASSYLMRESEAKVYGTSGMYWVPILFDTLKTTAYLIVPFLLWRKRTELNRGYKSLFSFYLFLYAIINFLRPIPVLGERFYWFIQILSVYLLLVAYGDKAKKYLIIILNANSWFIFNRYFFRGAVARAEPPLVFYSPTPYILHEYWGLDKMDTAELENSGVYH